MKRPRIDGGMTDHRLLLSGTRYAWGWAFPLARSKSKQAKIIKLVKTHPEQFGVLPMLVLGMRIGTSRRKVVAKAATNHRGCP